VLSVTRKDAETLAAKYGHLPNVSCDVAGLRDQLYGLRYSRALIDWRLRPGSHYRTAEVDDWWARELLTRFPYADAEGAHITWVEEG
jgi:hypothetical protein